MAARISEVLSGSTNSPASPTISGNELTAEAITGTPQAMACGVPVIASAVSSLPEIVGEAGLLVDPLSTSEIRAAMQRLLLSPSLRVELAAKARRRAAWFRWERAAAASVGFFERAVS